MSALDTNGVAKVCAAIDAGDGAVMLYDDEMRDVIDALDDRERAIGRERTRAEAAEAEVARLRAIVEGRTVAPSDAEIDAHWRAGGAWLVGRTVVTGAAEARRLASLGIAGVTWVALDGLLRGGAPCPWPVPA